MQPREASETVIRHGPAHKKDGLFAGDRLACSSRSSGTRCEQRFPERTLAPRPPRPSSRTSSRCFAVIMSLLTSGILRRVNLRHFVPPSLPPYEELQRTDAVSPFNWERDLATSRSEANRRKQMTKFGRGCARRRGEQKKRRKNGEPVF